jgi:hypothetical protein
MTTARHSECEHNDGGHGLDNHRQASAEWWISLFFLPVRYSSPHVTSYLSMTAQSIVVLSNRFVRPWSECSMTESTTSIF